VRRLPIAHFATTAPLHGSRSLAASLPCRATGWLSVCVCAIAVCLSVPHFAARLACLPQKCLLPATCCCCSSYFPYATCLPPPNPTRPPTHPRLHPASHIPDYRVGCPHPIHRSRPRLSLSSHQYDDSSAAHPSLALLRLGSSRGALPASPLLRVAHGGEPLHALLSW
jgi:hypothetical protein